MSKLHPTRMAFCSTLAIATGLLVGAGPGRAQALLGTVTSSTGVGTITTGPGSTIIPVTSQQAVINWSATGPSNGGMTTFSNAGSNTSFTGTSNFAVLNRVAPTVAGNAIFMGGNIRSSINEQVGGTVYFYSPNGIVIGNTASINVGSLGLTTLPIADNQGVWMTGFGTGAPSVAFGAATNAASLVRTEAGGAGALTASGAGNYVALVAPRVEHRGTIRTDSGAALVAAGAATITFRPSGLYDIAVTSGSSDPAGVIVDGGRIERNSAALGAPHRAYLVSVPANNAMTMLVRGGSQLGFDIAGSAVVEGNAVVLSTGHDIVNGAAGSVSAGAGGTDGDLNLFDSSFTSRVDATARDFLFVDANSGTVRFSDDLTLRARTGQIEASGAGTQLLVGGDLSINVARTATGAGETTNSGSYNILAVNGATITVAGLTSIDASARGGNSSTAGVASGSATGGTVFLQAQLNSILNFNGGLTVRSDGTAGSTGAGVNSGTGRGGAIHINPIRGNSSINVRGALDLNANGSGGAGLAECNTCGGVGGAGFGGFIGIQSFNDAVNSTGTNNNLSVTGAASLTANGSGTRGGNGASGAGQGGSVTVITSTTGLLDFQGAVTMHADGRGGDHQARGLAGSGTGGTAGVFANGGGIVTIAGSAALSSDGAGGSSLATGGIGGSGRGGSTQLGATVGSLTLRGNAVLTASSSGGRGAAEGGDAFGGSATLVTVSGGDLTVAGNANLSANATAGSGVIGGDASGGLAQIASSGLSSTVTISGDMIMAASGFGSNAANDTTNAGNGTGGVIALQALNGARLGLTGRLAADVNGQGGDHGFSNGAGGAGTGGTINLTATGGDSAVAVGGVTALAANGTGGSAIECSSCSIAGGSGTGGVISVTGSGRAAESGANRLDFNGGLSLAAAGRGGSADASGGTGRGGTLRLTANDGTIVNSLSSFDMTANGFGGAHVGSGAGNGGAGTGGDVEIGALQGAGGTFNLAGTLGSVILAAEGSGGSAGGTGAGGEGQGGRVAIDAVGAAITLTGNILMIADGQGGNALSGGTGGRGAGGNVLARAAGHNLTIDGDLFQFATAFGGNGLAGGIGQGGIVSAAANSAGTLRVGGLSYQEASGVGGAGGAGSGGSGGGAIGGDVSLVARTGGALAIGAAQLSAFGVGGNGYQGGAAQGGHGTITSNAGNIDIADQVDAFVMAFGGTSDGGNGGNATGGRFELVAEGGTLDVGGLVNLSSGAFGGTSLANLATGGAATGGGLQVHARGGGTLTLMSALSASSEGRGGEAPAATARGGDGRGGSVDLGAIGSNSTLDARGAVTLLADGFGGSGVCGECASGGSGGSGGNGTGGQAFVQTSGGNGNRVLFGSAVQIGATGLGGLGHGGPGGFGQGGAASVFLADDGRITVGSGLAISARGDGGSQTNGGQAGAGIGGDAQINLAGGPTSLLAVGINPAAETNRGTTLDSSGHGGSAVGTANGSGGAGTGGWSRIYGTGGSADFRGAVRIEATGGGGNGANGAGGAGIGGRARLNADGAAYRIGGSVAIVTDATGGSGRDGGAASLRAVVVDPNNSGMFANNGGSILVDGAATVSANALGGAGTNGGHGGAASAGRSSVVVNGSATGDGSITLASVTATATATGGGGAAGTAGGGDGGDGGEATGGQAELIVNNSASGTNRLTIGLADLDASGTGGNGGPGGDAATGLGGGAGGKGSGGTTLALTGSGNGALAMTDLFIFATGSGGAGGGGGSGSAGRGGNGGAGGVGDGGTVVAGMVSGTATATTAGTFNAATLIGWADSYGGAGGNGGSGTLGLGNGGHGGNALHSFNQLIARGGTVTIGDARLLVDTRGGDGGTGAIGGTGGTAFTPDILVTVTNRFEQPAAGATLNVGTLNFYSFAQAGTGAVAGQAIALGGPQLLVQNSRAQFGSYRAIGTAGDGIEPTSLADPIRIINGSVTVDREFHVASDNRMSVLIDNGSLSAGSVTLDAFNFERDTTSPAPTTFGTISGGTIALMSGRDIVLDANLSSTGALTLNAPGAVTLGTLAATGATGSILVTAGTNLTTGAITARNDVSLNAAGATTTGAVSSQNGAIRVAGGGSLATGDLAAGGGVLLDARGAIATGNIAARRAELIATGAIAAGNVTTSEGFDAEAGGALAVGNVTAGEHIALAAQGAVRAGNLSAGLVNNLVREGAEHHVGILSGAAVTVGNVAARDWIGIGARGTLGAGTIASGNDVVLAADGAITAGAITTGTQNRLLIAGADMIALGGPAETFDRNRVFAALGTPAAAATRDAVTIGGAVSTRRMDALVGSDFTAGAITADTASITAGRNVTLGTMAMRDQADVAAGGLLALNGNVAGAARFTSSDIEVAEGVRIDRARLVSRNAQGTFVGDAIGGEGGYRLSNAEYGRFGSVGITADTSLGAGSTMTIGDLTVATAGASEFAFRVSSDADKTPTGVIRIVGDVRYNGAVGGSDAAARTAASFEAGRFELDSATGSLALVNAAGGLAGSIDISARHVWVADTAVLARLGTDPTYAGLAADLARPPTTASPDGVIRADTINVTLARPAGEAAATGPAYSVYVQNTGTAAAPAGFAARTANVETDEATPPAIDLNVYGQIVTPGSTLTGVAVRDTLMADDSPARFTAGSLINGCALTGACGAATAPPFDPQPAISTEIALLATPPADDALFGNEEAIEDNEEEGGDDSASSPISPPAPLFNTKPLEAKSDTDEPVSGGGNPALIGSGRVEGEK